MMPHIEWAGDGPQGWRRRAGRAVIRPSRKRATIHLDASDELGVFREIARPRFLLEQLHPLASQRRHDGRETPMTSLISGSSCTVCGLSSSFPTSIFDRSSSWLMRSRR